MFTRKWNKKDRAKFLMNAGKCLSQGYPLHLAIKLQGYHQKKTVIKFIDKILGLLQKGHPLHLALNDSSFPSEVCSFIFYAEKSGQLADGLYESGEMLRKREEHKETLQKLLRYPLFLLWMFIMMIFLISQYLFPSFQRLYQSMDIELPWFTKFLMLVSDHLYVAGGLILFFTCSLFVLILFLYNRLSSEKKMTILLHFPIVSTYVKLYFTHYFSFHFGSLLKTGMSVNEALKTLAEQKFMSFFQREAIKMQSDLKRGERLDLVIHSRPFYVKEFSHVIHNGQLNGMLGPSLFDYSDIILKRMEEQTKTWLAVIQPATLILIGLLILFLFLSIMLPVFNIMNGL
ncbi:competence type IV pilus assembly protein ComGB [Scopulibacillus cellulosilyticus]|uniref:Competence type IV pilus assembly protein ComGB n=1 Tax=Scopulibacillus cellulosilyticus TaxID=2665665 RepID=A0ABW2PZX2_9BACL